MTEELKTNWEAVCDSEGFWSVWDYANNRAVTGWGNVTQSEAQAKMIASDRTEVERLRALVYEMGVALETCNSTNRESMTWGLESPFQRIVDNLLAAAKLEARAALAQPVQCTACGHKWETTRAIVTYCPQCGQPHHIGGD